MRVLVAMLLATLCGSTFCRSAHAKFKSTGVPAFDNAVHKAVDYLNGATVAHKEETLVAYALFKAGEPVTAAHVQKGIQTALDRAMNSGYSGYDHVYYAGIDAMLLADVDQEKYFQALQNIANYVASVQRPDGSFSDSARSPADTSMTQYALLASWAAKRAGCTVRPEILDRAAAWHLGNSNGDGGFPYRPGQPTGDGKGNSSHTMTIAAAGSLGLARTMLFGPKDKKKTQEKAKFGVLEKVELVETKSEGSFPQYKPQVGKGNVDNAIARTLGWNEVRYEPVSKNLSRCYYYYALERACALNDVKQIKGQDWFRAYGDGLLTLQQADGSFKSFTGSTIPTSFAILYYMRSTKAIIDKLYGVGIQKGGRDLGSLFGEKKKKEVGQLDELLAAIEGADLESLEDLDTDDIVESVQFGSKEELVGQVDKLKLLLKSPDAAHRATAFYALGRTGDFELIPEMIRGLRDPHLDVNVEALRALRYIARKPNGFGLSLDPLQGSPLSSEDDKVRRANAWRTKAFKAWGNWYRRVRPYEDGDGIDELELSGAGR